MPCKDAKLTWLTGRGGDTFGYFAAQSYEEEEEVHNQVILTCHDFKHKDILCLE